MGGGVMSFRNLSKTFKYINENGDSITFEYDYGFLINKPDGIDTLAVAHNQAQGINQVGSTIQSSNVQSRPVTISGILVGDWQAEMRRLSCRGVEEHRESGGRRNGAG